jgi:KDEL-tailed cysteine endopeptidase
MNKSLILIASAALLIAAGIFNANSNTEQIPAHIHSAFNSWAQKFGKIYSSPAERTYRLSVFYKTVLNIAQENSIAKTYTFGLNQFSDMTPEEFKIKHTGVRFTSEKKIYETPKLTNLGDFPDVVDWVKAGAVTPVADEKNCGATYAFASVDALSAAWKINGSPLVVLSV